MRTSDTRGLPLCVPATMSGIQQSAAAILGSVPALTVQETIAGMTVPPILTSMANAITTPWPKTSIASNGTS